MELMDSKRKVVLLKGDSNKWYEQAIFIMRPHAAQEDIDFLKEAEMIMNSNTVQHKLIEQYEKMGAHAPLAPLSPPPAPPQAKKAPPRKSRFDAMLNFTLIVTGIALVAVFAYNFM
ncbi:MAG: hypothetical protein FWC67_04165 [Defluviitaleaceae bacterium]|nr:hypothetical protein [Defluviitaleaceae bacterium]